MEKTKSSPLRFTHCDLRVDALLRLFAQGTGGPTLVLPYWQREYDWKQSLIERFVRTLRLGTHDRPMSIGAIVLGHSTAHPDEWILVDGQQRLRTLLHWRSLVSPEQEPKREKIRFVRGSIEEGGVATLDTEEWEDEERVECGWQQVKEQWEKIGRPDASSWEENVTVHLILAMFEGDATSDESFHEALSTLFGRINRTSRRLDILHEWKARCLQTLLQNESLYDEKVVQFVSIWEALAAQAMRPMELDETSWEEVRQASLLTEEKRGQRLLVEFPSQEDHEALFARLLITAKDLAPAWAGDNENNVTWQAPHRTKRELLHVDGPLREIVDKEMSQVTHVAAFLMSMERLQKTLEAWHDVLMLSHEHLPKKEAMTDSTPSVVDVGPAEKRLLVLEAFVESATKSRSWTETSVFRHVAVALGRDDSTDLEHRTNALRRAVNEAESVLFSGPMVKSDAATQERLLSRDWFLWRVLGDECCDEGMLVQTVPIFKRALDQLFDTASGLFAKTEDELYKDLRDTFSKLCSLPSSTGAAEVEHWVPQSVNDGKKKPDNRIDELFNKALISKSLNLQLSNLSLRDKAQRVLNDLHDSNSSVRPTLCFLAVLAQALSDEAGIVGSLQDDKAREQYFNAIEDFWKVVEDEFRQMGD